MPVWLRGWKWASKFASDRYLHAFCRHEAETVSVGTGGFVLITLRLRQFAFKMYAAAARSGVCSRVLLVSPLFGRVSHEHSCAPAGANYKAEHRTLSQCHCSSSQRRRPQSISPTSQYCSQALSTCQLCSKSRLLHKPSRCAPRPS